MKIKTFVGHNPEDFDKAVNEYLARGYRLNECGPRQIGNGEWGLYARLVLLEDDDE
ncbi:MAG: hypothetical protein IKY91_08225 [Akkermansia sp.]|nr:hypothetical protein [Akkermansia sp.]